MRKISRRAALKAISGSVLIASIAYSWGAVAQVIPSTNDDGKPLGNGATYTDLQSLLQAFFGSVRGAYLPRYVVDENDRRSDVQSDLVYSQFVGVYGDDFTISDTRLPNGIRMIVHARRHEADFKSIVFLDPMSVGVVAAAMTFFECPPKGIDESEMGQVNHVKCSSQISVIVFHKTKELDSFIEAALKDYFSHNPSAFSGILHLGDPSIKIYGREIS